MPGFQLLEKSAFSPYLWMLTFSRSRIGTAGRGRYAVQRPHKNLLAATTKRRAPLTGKDQDALKHRLYELSDRIETRVRELKQRGAFSDVHEAGMDEIHKRSASIKEKLDAAIGRGCNWDLLKFELERDFHSLNEDFGLFEKRLDADTMKQGGKGGST
jgi:hypothetical protein